MEDEDGLRSLNARGLRSRGYSVIEASNGIEAMEALEEKDGAVDLVVSDVVMPEMDGPTLLREMRKRNPNLKIIFVSGYAEEAFDKSLPENEQFAFLPKPFALSALVEKVKETMTRVSRLRRDEMPAAGAPRRQICRLRRPPIQLLLTLITANSLPNRHIPATEGRSRGSR